MAQMDRKRILYVSPNSLLGGGEINQMLLVSNVDKTAFDVEVVVGADGPYAQELRRRSIPVSVIPMAPIRDGSGLATRRERRGASRLRGISPISPIKPPGCG